jgi:hypothetical protein
MNAVTQSSDKHANCGWGERAWIPISALLGLVSQKPLRARCKHCCCTARPVPMNGLLARATNAYNGGGW